MIQLPSVAVWSGRAELGLGRVSSLDGTPDVARFTVVAIPGEPPQHFDVPISELEARPWEEGQRVYVRFEGRLQPGRIREDPDQLLSCPVLPEYEGAGHTTICKIVTFVGDRTYRVPENEILPLSGASINDPTGLLAEQLTEGQWWYSARRRIRDGAIAQRHAYAGISALASAAISVEEHQFRIARRILHDPLCRYVLADEVGLGKTIEAGIILRQHLIESQTDFGALVVVPEHLEKQWDDELRHRFGLGRHLSDGHVVLTTLSGLEGVLADRLAFGEAPAMLLIDEAHHLSDSALSDSSQEREWFSRLAQMSHGASRVLLLSATPVLRNESGFLAMLHLLDPTAHPLHDLDGFRQRVEKRQPIGELIRLLAAPVPRLAHAGTCSKIRGLLGDDPVIATLVDEFETAEREQWPEIQRKLSSRIRRTHRLYDRLIRTRRSDPAVENALPTRRVRSVNFEDPLVELAEEVLEEWRSGAIASQEGETLRRAGGLFARWIALLLESPEHLFRAWADRVADLEQGHVEPVFRSEEVVLRSATPASGGGSIRAVADSVRGILLEGGTDRLVVFLSAVEDCVRAADLVGMQATVLEPQSPSPHQRVWFVPRHLEEGLNLQEGRTRLIHADLPLSQVRTEQRIGRVDRLGGRQLHVESIVLLGGGAYQQAWYQCLQTGTGVFSRSVSNIQYLLAKAEGILREELLEHGLEAFHRVSTSLSAADGELSIAHEERRILEQDLLDSIGYEHNSGSNPYELAEAHEYGGEAEAFAKAVYEWTVAGLKFKALDTDGDRYAETQPPPHETPFQFLVRDRHIPRSMIHKYLAPALRPAGKYWKSEWVTIGRKPDRDLSGTRMPLPLRIGNHFVDGMLATLEVDGRGRGVALWVDRSTPLKQGAYFCFEFILELRFETADPTLRRTADRFFPPEVRRMWVTEDAELVSQTIVEVLDRVLVKNHQGIRSVKDSVTWQKVEETMAGDWRSTCRVLRVSAEERLLADKAFADRVSATREAVDREHIYLHNQLKERDEALPQAGMDREALLKELRYLEEIGRALETIQPRVDAVGALIIPPTDQ